jgi:hypothetical protein
MFLRDGFTATGSGELGTIRLAGAHIGGNLECNGATVRNDSGPALDGDQLRVETNVFLREGFTATGSGEYGTIRLPGAHIGRNLDCDGGTIHNDNGPALHGDRLHVDNSLFLRSGFKATGEGLSGTIRLVGAHVGGNVECDSATLINRTGPALNGDRLRVDNSMFLREKFDATGGGARGAIRLIGGQVGGQLSCIYATFHNDTGPAISAYNLTIDQSMHLDDGFSATGGGNHPVVDLVNVRISGPLNFDPARLEHASDPHLRLNIDDLVYNGIPRGIRTRAWLDLFRDGTASYAAQPYQQLAAAHRASGHDREARRILMAQRRDQIDRALTNRAERVWARLTGVTLGYGYQPWRALIGLLAVVTTGVILAVVLGAHGGLAQVRTPPSPTPVACTAVDRIGVGLDLGTPLVTTGTRSRCDTTDTEAGQALAVSGWVLRLLAWAFATLFIAGFTGAVRKT